MLWLFGADFSGARRRTVCFVIGRPYRGPGGDTLKTTRCHIGPAGTPNPKRPRRNRNDVCRMSRLIVGTSHRGRVSFYRSGSGLNSSRTHAHAILFSFVLDVPIQASPYRERDLTLRPLWSKCVSCGAGLVLPGHGASTAPLGWRQWLRGGVRFTPWHRGRRGWHSRCVENGRQLRR
jgi:hypothetical protein